MLQLLSMTLAAAVPPVVGEAAPLEGHWAAIAACSRVGGGPDGGPVATAVCVGNRDGFAYLLTAAHTVPKGEARAYEFFTRASFPKPARTLTRGDVVLRLAEPDIALVKLPTGMEPLPCLRLAGPGQRPKRFPFDAVSVGCPDASLPRCRAEKIVDKKFVRLSDRSVAFYWQVAGSAVGGMSGGPLIDADGRVIGICSATQGGQSYFSHVDEILYGLTQNGYRWLFDP